MLIRRAELADIPHLMRMGVAFHASVPYLREAIPFDPDTFGQVMYGLILHGCAHSTIFVAEQDGIPCGMTACVVNTHWFNRNHLAAQELFWWVDEQSRGSSAGVRLFNALEEWLEQSGAQSITVSSTSAENAAGVGRFFVKRGYFQCDINYVKGKSKCLNQS